jgi:4-methyl-5(b-hydroxyethyl)-thiazole monophosphate biosynthesis
MKIGVYFADGTEELEALTPVDILKRAGASCDIISVSKEVLSGSHDIKVVSDKLVSEIDEEEYDAFVIPGGMPGAVNITNNEDAVKIIKTAYKKGKLIASICASPAVVLCKHGLIEGKATCYPAKDFVDTLGDFYTGSDVETYKNVITANGPKSAFKFALEICKYLKIEPKF